MNRKPLTPFLAAALAVLLLAGLQAAVSTAPEAPEWEYKIVAMMHCQVEREAEAHTDTLNQLGSESWELVPIDGLRWDNNETEQVFKRRRK